MQLTYEDQQPKGYHGSLATGVPHVIVTRVANAAVSAGQLVCTDPTGGDLSVKPVDSAANATKPQLVGMVLRDETKVDNQTYAAGEPIAVLVKGAAWLEVESAVVDHTNAFVRHVAGGAEVLGSLRADADGTDAVVNTSIRFLETVGAGEVCKVELDL